MHLFNRILLFIVVLSFCGAIKAQIATPSNSLPQRTNVCALLEEAFAREEAGDLNGAIVVYRRILQVNPKEVRAMSVIAGLYGKLSQIDKEIFWAKKAIAVDPQFWRAYINYGNALGLRGRFCEAAKAYEKARQLSPTDPIPVYSLGVLAEQQQKFEEALNYYRETIQLDPEFEYGYYNLAATYANLRRYDEAIANLKKVLELNSTAENAKAMLQEIENERRKQ